MFGKLKSSFQVLFIITSFWLNGNVEYIEKMRGNEHLIKGENNETSKKR